MRIIFQKSHSFFLKESMCQDWTRVAVNCKRIWCSVLTSNNFIWFWVIELGGSGNFPFSDLYLNYIWNETYNHRDGPDFVEKAERFRPFPIWTFWLPLVKLVRYWMKWRNVEYHLNYQFISMSPIFHRTQAIVILFIQSYGEPFVWPSGY